MFISALSFPATQSSGFNLTHEMSLKQAEEEYFEYVGVSYKETVLRCLLNLVV